MLFTCITVTKWVSLSENKVSFIIINIALIGHKANLSSILTQYLINTHTHCFFKKKNLQRVIQFLQYTTTHTILQHIQTGRGSSYMAFRMQKKYTGTYSMWRLCPQTKKTHGGYWNIPDVPHTRHEKVQTIGERSG